MVCPRCGSYKISETTHDGPKLYQYWCLECQEGWNDGDYEMSQENMIQIYTDGACYKNPGPAGAGVLLRYNGHEKRISKFLGNATNNIAELTAIKLALEAVTDRSKPVMIYSDSQYSIGVVSNPDWNPKKNKELIKEIKDLIVSFECVDFEWVKAHSGIEGNEIVDELAVRAYKTKKDFEARGTTL